MKRDFEPFTPFTSQSHIMYKDNYIFIAYIKKKENLYKTPTYKYYLFL